MMPSIVALVCIPSKTFDRALSPVTKKEIASSRVVLPLSFKPTRVMTGVSICFAKSIVTLAVPLKFETVIEFIVATMPPANVYKDMLDDPHGPAAVVAVVQKARYG